MSMFSLYKDADRDKEEEKKKPPVPHNKSHRLADASDDDSAAFLRVSDDTKQVDFYKNPTILSRLLLSNKYSSAIKRVKSHPQEASVWVAMKRNPFKREQLLRTYLRKDRSDRSFQGSVQSISASQKNFYNVSKKQRQIMVDYSMRQLPIHMACSSLIRPTKPEEQMQLEKLIALLVVTYPDGCELCDHEGKLPLHEAIWHNASSDTISMMLMAFPRSLHERDRFGRSPLDLNRIRSGGDKDKVKGLLVKGVSFWEQARAQAFARMGGSDETDRETTGDQDSVSTMTSASTMSLRPDPKGNLNPAIRNLSRHIKQGTDTDGGSLSQPSQGNDDEFSVVEPISWVKLEQRAVYLEQLLAGMYEKNYELEEAVEELTRERLELQEELEKNSMYESSCTDESLFAENERLREEVATLTRALSDTKDSDSKTSSSFAGGSTDSFQSYTLEQRDAEQTQYLRDLNSELQEEVNHLNGKIQQYESQVNRLEIIIAATNRPANRDDDVSVEGQLAMIPEDGSPGKNEFHSSTSAQNDLDSLVESLSINSRYATERYLAGKIQLLEARLDEEMAAREADVLANNHENKRLLLENAALQSEIGRLSTRSLGGLQVQASRAASSQNSFGMASSNRSGLSDDCSTGDESQFEVILNEAFQLYGSNEASDPLISSSSSTTADMNSDSTNPMEQLRDEVQRIESQYGKPVPIEVKMSLVSAVSSLSLGTNTVLDGDDGDLDTFLQEASRFYGRPIPADLQSAMEGTSLLSLSNHHIIVPTHQPDRDDDLGKLFEEAGRLYQKPIPVEIRSAVREVTASELKKNVSDDILSPPSLPISTQSSFATKQELENILNEAEKASGTPIPVEMRHALLTVSFSSDDSSAHLVNEQSVRSDSSSFRSHNDSTASETDEIELLFHEAEKLYHKPIPAGVKSVVRNAVASSGVSEGSTNHASPDIYGLSADPECELDNIIRDAERAYGKSLPADLKVALLTASVSSGLSLRSFGDSARYFEDEDRDSHIVRDELELMFQEAAILYKQPIPTEVEAVVRDKYASSLVSPSPESHLRLELECIIRDAEIAIGKPLPEDLKLALRTASVSSKLSSPSQEPDAPNSKQSDSGAIQTEVSPSVTASDDLNEIFLTAAREFGLSGKVTSASSCTKGRSEKRIGTTPAHRVTNMPSLTDTFASDNLEDIFSSAARDLSQADSSKSSRSVGSASTEAKTYLPSKLSTAVTPSPPKPPTVTESSELSGPENDLNSILQAAELSYGMELPEDLKRAIRNASLKAGLSFRTTDLIESSSQSSTLGSTLSKQEDVEEDDLEKMFEQAQYKVFNKGPVRSPVDVDVGGDEDALEKLFEEAARMYDKPIPEELMDAMREAVTPRDGHLASDFDEASDSSFDNDDLESIIREAETSNGGAISNELKNALLDS